MSSQKTEISYLAAGCFWGVQKILSTIDGVVETKVGYMGGATPSPTYEQITTGSTGHAESISVEFNPEILSYKELLSYFFRLHDPTTIDQQKNDVGSQYRSAIFTTTPEQNSMATALITELSQLKVFPHPIVTQIGAARNFTSAEDYHQDYLTKNPDGYNCHLLAPPFRNLKL